MNFRDPSTCGASLSQSISNVHWTSHRKCGRGQTHHTKHNTSNSLTQKRNKLSRFQVQFLLILTTFIFFRLFLSSYTPYDLFISPIYIHIYIRDKNIRSKGEQLPHWRPRSPAEADDHQTGVDITMLEHDPTSECSPFIVWRVWNALNLVAI